MTFEGAELSAEIQREGRGGNYLYIWDHTGGKKRQLVLPPPPQLTHKSQKKNPPPPPLNLFMGFPLSHPPDKLCHKCQ